MATGLATGGQIGHYQCIRWQQAEILRRVSLPSVVYVSQPMGGPPWAYFSGLEDQRSASGSLERRFPGMPCAIAHRNVVAMVEMFQNNGAAQSNVHFIGAVESVGIIVERWRETS